MYKLLGTYQEEWEKQTINRDLYFFQLWVSMLLEHQVWMISIVANFSEKLPVLFFFLLLSVSTTNLSCLLATTFSSLRFLFNFTSLQSFESGQRGFLFSHFRVLSSILSLSFLCSSVSEAPFTLSFSFLSERFFFVHDKAQCSAYNLGSVFSVLFWPFFSILIFLTSVTSNSRRWEVVKLSLSPKRPFFFLLTWCSLLFPISNCTFAPCKYFHNLYFLAYRSSFKLHSSVSTLK